MAGTNRRSFLGLVGAAALRLDAGAASSGRALRGIFPIAQTPFTSAGELDLESLT